MAHCDPEGDWNSVLLATGADVIARGPSGERAIPIDDFVAGVFTNSLGDDEAKAGFEFTVNRLDEIVLSGTGCRPERGRSRESAPHIHGRRLRIRCRGICAH